MSSFLDQPQFRYLGVAVFMLFSALGILKWVQRALREQIAAVSDGRDDAAAITHADSVPQALVKVALERGLVSAAQLAAMAPRERLFLFSSLQERLAADVPHPTPGPTAPPHAPAVPTVINAAEFGLASMPVNTRLHVHCPMCGEALILPAFAPFVAHCAQCGTKTALREDEPGHYLLNVTPALKVEAPRPQHSASP
ncbi:MAG TPA: hypothetical protein VHE78_08975 [Gemmatimonadaceae bacterium]|nr:hypothetical protein [Gemmatimonadaceae bacterium]